MALAAGSRMGPYEILAPLGAGGMGEVYRGRDTRLDRTVAVKVLPAELRHNPELHQRFAREARALSSLSHPNICQLYDVGHQDGMDYLVMEYLDGETLEDRLAKGRLPLEQALKIGVEIADALDKAHRQGIVHRDLKPSNIMLCKGGAKLMDFGLAKPAAPVLTGSAAEVQPSPATLTLSTAALSSAAGAVTQQGQIVGTFQYMAPEVLQGRDADARSDIFALGAVLYEITTGRRAFDGKSQISVAATILENDPEPVTKLQPLAPAALEWTIKACLAKDPDSRIQTAHDVKLQLQWIAQAPTNSAVLSPAAGMASRGRRRTYQLVLTATVLLLSIALAWQLARDQQPRRPVIRAVIPVPEKTSFEFVGDTGGPPQLSPDGQQLVFAARTSNDRKLLFVRSLDSTAAQPLEGTEGASFPFWSPDSRSIAFFAEGKLKKVGLGGGAPVTLCEAQHPRGGSWSRNGTILFAPEFRGALWRVSADGGHATRLTTLDARWHTTHRWPVFLPDGNHFLYLATNHAGGTAEKNGIYCSSLDGKENRMLLINDGGPIYASGYLLYHSGNALMAQKFDPTAGRLSGEARSVVDNVTYTTGTWHVLATASQTGILAFQNDPQAAGSELVWFDRTGKEIERIRERNRFMSPRLSPNGRELAVIAGDPAADVYIFDLMRGVKSRLTFDPASHREPVWSPDGKRVGYSSVSGGGRFGYRLWIASANGETKPEMLIDAPDTTGQLSFMEPEWSPDGRYVVFSRGNGPAGREIWAKPLFGDGQPFALVTPRSPEGNLTEPRISPDGRWMAYVSNDSGRGEVYVTSFPKAGPRWQISSDGADYPTWQRAGKELYFLGNDATLYAVKFHVKASEFQAGTPKRLFHLNLSALGHPYDVSADGTRFLVNTAAQNTSTPITVVVNWTDELPK